MRKILICLLFIVLFTCPAFEGSAATAPTITRHPMNWTALINTMAEFSVTAIGTEPLRYQWQNGSDTDGIWSDIAGANSADYSFIANASSDSAPPLYRVVVSNGYGSATSYNARLTVTYPHPISPQITIDTQPIKNTAVTEGSIVGSISAKASLLPIEAGEIVYQWYSNTTNSNMDGTLISGATSASFTIPKTLTASGSPYYYYCSVEANDTSGDFITNKNTEVAVITVNNTNDSDSGNGGCNSIMSSGGMFGILTLLSTLLLGQKKKTAKK